MWQLKHVSTYNFNYIKYFNIYITYLNNLTNHVILYEILWNVLFWKKNVIGNVWMRSEVELLIVMEKKRTELGHLRTLIMNPYLESKLLPNLCKCVTGGITFPHFTTPYYICSLTYTILLRKKKYVILLLNFAYG